jgi:hypothetical protein
MVRALFMVRQGLGLLCGQQVASVRQALEGVKQN